MRRQFLIRFPSGGTVRRGAAAPLVAVSSVILVGMAALAIDSGVLYQARTEMQAAADAAALAAANELVARRSQGFDLDQAITAARAQAVSVGGRNRIMGRAPVLEPNLANAPDGDVVVGYLRNPDDLQQPLSFAETDLYNTILVRVRRNGIRNGPIDLFFANIFGIGAANLESQAAAIAEEGARGFRTPESSSGEQSPLLPLALHVDAWRDLLNGTVTNGDQYHYDPETKKVTSGHDGIHELNIYPGSGTGTQKLTPGNFGTVDIGNPNNSTSDLARQIRNGPNASDFAYFGGKLELGPDGTVQLNGDTGLSAGIKDDLEAIKGQPRVVPLFNRVTGNGNNSMFTVVGFAGIRIVNVRLTGSMKTKEVMIQPATVIDGTVITGRTTETNTFVYGPVRLVR